MRARISLIAVGLICTVTAACVRTDAEMLDASSAIVSARGTAFDHPATVLKATVAEIAKLAQARGFAYFTIVSAQDATRTATMVLHGDTHTSGSISGSVQAYGDGFGSVSGTYSGTSSTSPDQVINLAKPGSDVVVRFFHEGEVDPRAQGIWSVAAVMVNVDGVAPPPPAPRPVVAVQPLPSDVAAPALAPQAQAQRYSDWHKAGVDHQ